MSKPLVETLLNTAAISLSSWGVIEVTTKYNYYGLLIILFGALLELIKYYGRKKLW